MLAKFYTFSTFPLVENIRKKSNKKRDIKVTVENHRKLETVNKHKLMGQ